MNFSKNLVDIFIPTYKSTVLSIPIFTIWFLAYLELSPYLGNIWYRVASDGIKYINLGGLVEFIYKPFVHSFFWHPRYWDLNIYISFYATNVLINLIYKIIISTN